MFPSLLVQPETTLFSYWLVSSVLAFGFILNQFKKIIAALSFSMILILPSQVHAFMAAPGGCGSACMMTWGRPTYPSAYYYPQMTPNPYSFYGDPMSFYPMLRPWYAMGALTPTPFYRGVQSIETNADEKE